MSLSAKFLFLLPLLALRGNEKLVEGTKSSFNSFNPRVIGGQTVKPGEIPYQVSIQSHDGTYFCGGSIIQVGLVMAVLSAAHCFTKYSSANPEDWLARAGTVEFEKDTEGLQIRQISRIVAHECFNWLTQKNDIALLFPNATFQISDLVKPIKLPKEDEAFTDADAIVSGWGDQYGNESYSDQLLSIQLSVWDHADCQRKWETHPASQSEVIYDGLICIGDVAGNKSACHGDSGGPAAVFGNVLVGITSHGEESCNPNFPAIFTEVSHYIKWINLTINHFETEFANNMI